MSDELNGYEINQKGKDYIVLVDIQENQLIIKCINKTSGEFFSSKIYKLEDLHLMNKYFRISENIKEIQSLLNSAIEKAKIGLLEDFNQMTIFFYLILGIEENTIAFPLIKEKKEIEKNTEKKNSILKELINLHNNDNYIEKLENIIEKIEGENYILKQKALILSEHIKKLNIESEELKKESLILKEDNHLLKEENLQLLEYKKKYEFMMKTPFKSESDFSGEMQISSVINEIICSRNNSKSNLDNKIETTKQYNKLNLNKENINNDENSLNIIDNDNYENENIEENDINIVDRDSIKKNIQFSINKNEKEINLEDYKNEKDNNNEKIIKTEKKEENEYLKNSNISNNNEIINLNNNVDYNTKNREDIVLEENMNPILNKQEENNLIKGEIANKKIEEQENYEKDNEIGLLANNQIINNNNNKIYYLEKNLDNIEDNNKKCAENHNNNVVENIKTEENNENNEIEIKENMNIKNKEELNEGIFEKENKEIKIKNETEIKSNENNVIKTDIKNDENNVDKIKEETDIEINENINEEINKNENNEIKTEEEKELEIKNDENINKEINKNENNNIKTLEEIEIKNNENINEEISKNENNEIKILEEGEIEKKSKEIIDEVINNNNNEIQHNEKIDVEFNKKGNEIQDKKNDSVSNDENLNKEINENLDKNKFSLTNENNINIINETNLESKDNIVENKNSEKLDEKIEKENINEVDNKIMFDEVKNLLDTLLENLKKDFRKEVLNKEIKENENEEIIKEIGENSLNNKTNLNEVDKNINNDNKKEKELIKEKMDINLENREINPRKITSDSIINNTNIKYSPIAELGDNETCNYFFNDKVKYKEMILKNEKRKTQNIIKTESTNIKQDLIIRKDRNKLFKDSKRLDFITSRIHKNKYKINLNLIYKASINGDKSSIFHEKCDKAQATIVLIETKDDKIFGGYTKRTWRGNNIEKADNDAFIFSLNNYKIYDIIKGKNGIGCYKEFNPYFSGAFKIFDNAFTNGGCLIKNDKNYQINDIEELIGSENKENLNEETNEEIKFYVDEIEVYEIKIA